MNKQKLKELEEIIRAEHGNICGIIVQQGGEILYESYFNGYAAKHAIHVASVTKSVFSALIGIAIDKGFIHNVKQKVLKFFPDYTIQPGEKTIQNITIEHLLTMTAPYKYTVEPYEKFFTSQNPIQDALDLLGGEEPIGNFCYSAIGGTHILSGILAKATGQPTLDFAKENLFSPLGINVTKNLVLRNKEEHIAAMNDKNSSGWVIDAKGTNTASWGLFLSPLDMAKIGQLYLAGGVWQGKQIVSNQWVTESTKTHSICREFGNLGYGYLWWMIDPTSYAALGDGGNVIYVNSKKQRVISIASLLMSGTKDRIELIKKQIEPIFNE